MDRESQECQTDAFMLALGMKADDILLAFRYNPGESDKDYATIFKKFEEYYDSKHNVVYHRARFNKRF